MTASAYTSGDYEYNILDDGDIFSMKWIRITGYNGSTPNLSIPSTIAGIDVTGIEDYAFCGCTNITNVKIPNKVVYIGNGAFKGCEDLTNVKIPNSVLYIGYSAFFATNLTSIAIPNSVEYICYDAFSFCRSLTNVTIPNSVRSIGEDAFFGCSILRDVYYSGTKEEWDKISIDKGNDCLKNATIHYNYVDKYKTSIEYKTPDQFKNITLKNNKDFSNIYFDDKSFAIPGLINTYLDTEGCCDFMTPQGVCKAGDYFIVTAYCGAEKKGTDTPPTHKTRHNSVLYILDATTSKPSYITTINLKNKNHVGGIAYDPDNKLIWITGKSDDSKKQYMVDAISYNFIDNLVKSSNYKDINDVEYVAQNKSVTVKSSYLTYYNNMLWVGDNSKSRFAGYKINEEYSLSQATEITYFKETDKISIFGGNDKIVTATNGMCFYDYNGKTYLGVTTSPGRSHEATLYTYRVDFENKNNKYVIKLDNKATFQLPRMAEELEVVGDKTYINFESASSCYFSFDKVNSRQPTDRICAVDTTGLFSKTINSKKFNYWTLFFKSSNKKSMKKARANQSSQNETISISSYSGNGQNVVIPETIKLDDVTYTVDSISSKAFEYNTNIKTITIPSTITEIEKEAFVDCPNLTAIKVSDDNPNYSSQDGALYNKDKTELIYVPEGLNDISIANSTETIAESAFLNSNISAVKIPDKVKKICNYAFGNCKNLKEIVVPKNVTEIEESALGYYFDVENESDEKVTDFKIKAYHNSVGEKYAKDSNIDCIYLDEKYVMLGIKGTYNVNIDEAIKRINAIRYESCQEGVINPITGKPLTLKDYVPIKWSSDLEYIARIRAAEASVTMDHIRTNNTFCLNIQSPNGITQSSEVLAWNGSDDMLVAIEQWYKEKSDWVKENKNAVTGHYTAMINPSNNYVGLGTFCTESGTYYNTTAGEFVSSSKNLDETKGTTVKNCIQELEVDTSALCGKTSIQGNTDLKIGEKSILSLVTDINYEDGYGKNLYVINPTWKISNNSIAAIELTNETSCKITAKKCGNASITASFNGINVTKAINIKHSYKSKITKQPTCTSTGVKTYTCSVCGDSYTETIAKTSHNYSTSWTIDKQATCTEAGSKSHHCTVCGDKKGATEIPATGHKFGSWTTTKKATCTTDGEQQRECSVCGKTETKTIPKTAHSYKKVTVASTYFEKGYTANKCSKCGAISNKKYTPLKTMSAPKASSNSTSSIKLSWGKVSGAKGYNVYQMKNGKWTRIKTLSGTALTVSKLKAGTTYQFCIKPYTKSGSKIVYGNISKTLTTSTIPATVTFKLTAGSRRVTVKWSNVTGTSGYKVYYKTSKNGSWKTLKTCSNKTTSYTKTGLSKGRTYYFTVKAYRTVGGKTYNGAFTTKSVKVK